MSISSEHDPRLTINIGNWRHLSELGLNKRGGMKLLSTAQIEIILDEIAFKTKWIEKRISHGLPVTDDLAELKEYVERQASQLDSKAVLDTKEFFKPREAV